MKSAIAVIKWDGDKCQTPMVCKICLELCPEQVFRSGFWHTGYKRGVEYSHDEPGQYKINPEWIDRCLGCMECVKHCPKDAIQVVFPHVTVKSAKKEKKELKLDEPDFVLDFRKIQTETKKMYELGGMSDKLKPYEVLQIVDLNPLGWAEKRFRMLRPGRFNVIETEEEGLHRLIVHRV